MKPTKYDFTLNEVGFIRRKNGQYYRFDVPANKIEGAIRARGVQSFKIKKQEYETARIAATVIESMKSRANV